MSSIMRNPAFCICENKGADQPRGERAADQRFFLLFFLIQFNVPFKIISLIETSQLIGGAKREYPRKTT